MKLYIGVEIFWKCKCKKVGMRVGNWFTGSCLSFETSILFIYAWTKKWTSVSWCEEELRISQHTVVSYNNYMLEVCAWKLEQD